MLAACYSVGGLSRDLNAARSCVDSVKKDAARDPYMLLTHANVVLAALPTDRQSRVTSADKENNKQFVLKVGPAGGGMRALYLVLRPKCQKLGCLGVPEGFLNGSSPPQQDSYSNALHVM